MNLPVISLIPAPASLTTLPGSFSITPDTALTAPAGPAGRFLGALLRRATGFPVPAGPGGSIVLALSGDASLGREGHTLEITPSGVRLLAHTDEGLFRGVQTLRQLLPAEIEARSAQPGPWSVRCVRVEDRPRFEWRGAMLDVVRHFFDVATVKGFIDRIAAYKLNVLHLHLTDDQGWRLEVGSRPRLTSVGATTEVGGGAGGFFTQADYAEIVAYAAEHHLTVVPEFDMPGHTQAAMASYPELAPSWAVSERVAEPLAGLLVRDGVRQLYTGTEVGFSELAVDKDSTYEFLDDVLGEFAALSPGPYLHIGGDEALRTTPEDYARFMARAVPLVIAHGKTVVAWQEAAAAVLPPGSLLQYWRPTTEPVPEILRDTTGLRLIMSPADRTYLDLKYDETTPIGLTWAGTVGVRQSYEWEPTSVVPGAEIAGVEAALWTETITSADDIDFMIFPRLPGVAEVGWSAPGRDWAEYSRRLHAHQARWDSAGITSYHRSVEL
ncbi:MAG: beta-N-acetylhexosaminidase [Streptosporangiaceae bacterium]